MLALAGAVLLFGGIHPFSKLILDTGIPLSYFCLLYVAIRLVIQLPALFFLDYKALNFKKALPLLLLLGVCGAGLQLFEFKGISEGLNPGIVTFLMFSYPVWLVLGGVFTGNKSLTKSNALKVSAGLIGIYFVSHSQSLTLQSNNYTVLIYPLLASLFIAAWIVISNRLRKANMASISLSLFYDLFSLTILVIIFSGNLAQDWGGFANWASTPSHLFYLTGYSIIFGLLPNLLFYFGSRFVSSLVAGMAMALEPVLSTLYSSMIWEIYLGPTFVLGAALILMANLTGNQQKPAVLRTKINA